jgi:hypothetical protein
VGLLVVLQLKDGREHPELLEGQAFAEAVGAVLAERASWRTVLDHLEATPAGPTEGHSGWSLGCADRWRASTRGSSPSGWRFPMPRPGSRGEADRVCGGRTGVGDHARVDRRSGRRTGGDAPSRSRTRLPRRRIKRGKFDFRERRSRRRWWRRGRRACRPPNGELILRGDCDEPRTSP